MITSHNVLNVVIDNFLKISTKKAIIFKFWTKDKTLKITYFKPCQYILVTLQEQLKDFSWSEPIRYSYHDSCWASDGTEKIFNLYNPTRISTIEEIDLTEEESIKFINLTRKY
jgi:hypothetical protein